LAAFAFLAAGLAEFLAMGLVFLDASLGADFFAVFFADERFLVAIT
jgi:hypothetical protein